MTLPPIQVRAHGSGESPVTVAVLHGGPGAPGSAAGLAQGLARDFQVLEPLQRRSGPARLTVERHVEDLAEILPAGAVLVGWSWGGMLGLSFAALHPGRAAALALVGCGTYHPDDRALIEPRVQRRLDGADRRRLQELRRELASSAADPARRDACLAELGRLFDRAGGHDLLPREPGEAALAVDARGHQETWDDVLRLQREHVEPQRFSAIRVPVLMIHGEADPHPGPATRDRLRGRIPHLEYRELARCGHEPWRERQARDEFLAALSQWIARHAPPA